MRIMESTINQHRDQQDLVCICGEKFSDHENAETNNYHALGGCEKSGCERFTAKIELQCWLCHLGEHGQINSECECKCHNNLSLCKERNDMLKQINTCNRLNEDCPRDLFEEYCYHVATCEICKIKNNYTLQKVDTFKKYELDQKSAKKLLERFDDPKIWKADSQEELLKELDNPS